jgi:uncharacterized phage-associated protein
MAKISEKKYENAVLFFIHSLGGVLKGKKKLAKLLYFADFDYFEKYEEPLIGDEYRAQPMGPLPVHMAAVVGKMEKVKKIKIHFEQLPGYEKETEIYTSSQKPDLSVFNPKEQAMLKRIVKVYGELNGTQLQVLSHNEAPYIGTAPGKAIMYELSTYRGTDFSDLANA